MKQTFKNGKLVITPDVVDAEAETIIKNNKGKNINSLSAQDKERLLRYLVKKYNIGIDVN
jgi:hypothetical protein